MDARRLIGERQPRRGAEPRRRGARLGFALTLLALLIWLPALASGAFSTPKTLSPAGQDASEPQIASDASGDAVAVWRRYDGTNFRIQASPGP